MAPRKPKAPVPDRGPLTPPDPETAEITDAPFELPANFEELEESAKLSVFHDMFGQKDYKVRVELFNKDENEFEIVDTPKLDGFDPYSSLKKYGGGRYRLTLLNDSGKYVKGGRMEVRIAKVAAEVAKTEEPAKAPAMDPSVMLLIESLKSQNAQNVEVLKAALGRPVTEAKGPSLSELVSVLSGLRGLTPKEDSDGGIMKTLGLLRAVKEIMPSDTPAEKSESVLSEIMEAVKVAQGLGIGPRRLPAPAAPAVPAAPVETNFAAPSIVVNPKPAPAPEDPSMKPVLDKVRSYLPQLTAWAKRGKDVDEVADFVLDELENEIVPLIVKHYKPVGVTLTPEIVFESLLSKASDPNEIAKIFAHAPELAPYKEWFERVVAKAVEFATAPAEEPTPENPNPETAAS